MKIGSRVTFIIPSTKQDPESGPITGTVLITDDKSDWIEVSVKKDWRTTTTYNIHKDWVVP